MLSLRTLPVLLLVACCAHPLMTQVRTHPKIYHLESPGWTGYWIAWSCPSLMLVVVVLICLASSPSVRLVAHCYRRKRYRSGAMWLKLEVSLATVVPVIVVIGLTSQTMRSRMTFSLHSGLTLVEAPAGET